MRSLLIFLLLTLFGGQQLVAAGLDDYYLQRFTGHAGTGTYLAGALLADPAPVERCQTPLHRDLARDWPRLATATQLVLAKQLAKPALAGEAIVRTSGGHFHIHYATSGNDAPPLADSNGNGIPDWIETVADTFEAVYAREVLALGYLAAPTAGGQPYDVYLQSLGPTNQFAYTQSDLPVAAGSTSFTSYIVIDNDYLDPIYAPYSALQGLKISASHEYHHAIQYGYNFYFDIWYAEATSTWLEDENYDSANQLYSYLPAAYRNTTLPLDSSVSVTTGGGYGRWPFNRYLTEVNGATTVRSAWEVLRQKPAPAGGGDIPMVPVLDEVLAGKLGDNFLGATKRIIVRNWASHQNEISLFPALPYTDSTTFTVNTFATAPVVALPLYSFASYRYLPGFVGSASLTIAVPAKPAAVTALAFRREPNGAISEYRYDAQTATIVVPVFATGDQVYLLLCNTGTGTSTTPAEPLQPIPSPAEAVSPWPGPPTIVQAAPPPASGGSGGGGGCFIATAAYGSYLHPKVMVLRQFRDQVLLPTRPGRLLVAAYYRLSPPLAEVIARHAPLRAACRWIITPLVLAIEHPQVAIGALMVLLCLRRRRNPAGTLRQVTSRTPVRG